MASTFSHARIRSVLWQFTPVVVVTLLALGYILGVALIEDGSGQRPHSSLPGVFMLAQAFALLARHRFPLTVLLFVTVLDAVTLLVSSGEIGTGTVAVMIAVFSYASTSTGRGRYLAPASLSVLAVIITMIAVQRSTLVPSEFVLAFALARNVLVFGLGVVTAEIVGQRARLLEALRERAEAAEYEKEHQAQEAVLRERALMARELHDVAAHHLTGIIVSAQAAETLRISNPQEAGEYVRQIQNAARTTLNNLRQTVGLLRADGESELAPIASIERLPELVAQASTTGTSVHLKKSGTPRDLGPLAGIAAYRMVQESLANSLSHAPGTHRAVQIDYGTASLRVTVTNGPNLLMHRKPETARAGYGLIGMAERAELLGARLRTGSVKDGSWVNTLIIPYEGQL